MESFPLTRYLHSAYNGSISSHDLNELIFFCRSMCEIHLRTFRPYIITLCKQEKVELADIAYECISPLFSTDEKKGLRKIRAFVDSLPKRLETIDENSLFISFRTFLTAIVNAEIAEYHVELDPIGAKILRGLKLAVKHSATARLLENAYGISIEPSGTGLPELQHGFPLELLERKLVVRNAMFKESPAFISDVVTILLEQDEYRRSVLLHDLVLLRKKYIQNEEKELLSSTAVDSTLDHLFSHHEMGRIREQALRFVYRKAHALYAEKGKLDDAELSVLIGTVQRIVEGWFLEERHAGHYIDVMRQIRPVTKEDYNRHWKVKLEYLIKLTKFYVVEKIEK